MSPATAKLPVVAAQPKELAIESMNVAWELSEAVFAGAIDPKRAAEIDQIADKQERLEQTAEVRERRLRNEESRDTLIGCGVSLPKINQILAIENNEDHLRAISEIAGDVFADLAERRIQDVSRVQQLSRREKITIIEI